MFESGTIGLEELFRWRWPRDRLGETGYWHHLASWWEQRHDERVLLLCYEDMKLDLEATVPRIARFLGIEVDAIWGEYIAPRFGLPSYEDLRRELRTLHAARA